MRIERCRALERWQRIVARRQRRNALIEAARCARRRQGRPRERDARWIASSPASRDPRHARPVFGRGSTPRRCESINSAAITCVAGFQIAPSG